MKRTPGRSKITGSPRRKRLAKSPPNALLAAQMVAEMIEIAPSVVYPLQIQTGARTIHLAMRPGEDNAMIDVLNTQDGNEYQILVMRKRPNGTGTPESSL